MTSQGHWLMERALWQMLTHFLAWRFLFIHLSNCFSRPSDKYNTYIHIVIFINHCTEFDHAAVCLPVCIGVIYLFSFLRQSVKPGIKRDKRNHVIGSNYCCKNLGLPRELSFLLTWDYLGRLAQGLNLERGQTTRDKLGLGSVDHLVYLRSHWQIWPRRAWRVSPQPQWKRMAHARVHLE